MFYAMDELTVVLGSAGGVAALIVVLTAQLRRMFPRQVTGARAPLVTLALGPALMLAGWALAMTPAAVTPQTAAVMGLQAALIANGWYSGLKAIGAGTAAIAAPPAAKPVVKPVVKATKVKPAAVDSARNTTEVSDDVQRAA